MLARPDTRSTVRWSPLLSDEGRLFLTGAMPADDYLETARRRAIEQTCQEMARYTRVATLAALVTGAFLLTGGGYLLLTGKTTLGTAAVTVSALSAVLAILVYCRLRRAHIPTIK